MAVLVVNGGVEALLIADARPLMVLEDVLIPLANDKSPLFEV